MKAKTFHIKIINCTNPRWWYHDKIGRVFKVYLFTFTDRSQQYRICKGQLGEKGFGSTFFVNLEDARRLTYRRAIRTVRTL
jgi:hypothetical protein